MLLRTYHKIIAVFQNYHGYMSFDNLRDAKITVSQIRELEDEGILEKISRGWYWCSQCGFEKPKDYKYIELAKINLNSVICLDSACYLHGILKTEPEWVSVATERGDRRKMEAGFSIRRFYLQNTGDKDEIQTVSTMFGEYRQYSIERSFCDCIRMKDRLEPSDYLEIVNAYQVQTHLKARVLSYAKALRAVKCVEAIPGHCVVD